MDSVMAVRQMLGRTRYIPSVDADHQPTVPCHLGRGPALRNERQSRTAKLTCRPHKTRIVAGLHETAKKAHVLTDVGGQVQRLVGRRDYGLLHNSCTFQLSKTAKVPLDRGHCFTISRLRRWREIFCTVVWFKIFWSKAQQFGPQCL